MKFSAVTNPHSSTLVPDHLAQYALLGRIIGLALLHGEQLDNLYEIHSKAPLTQSLKHERGPALLAQHLEQKPGHGYRH